MVRRRRTGAWSGASVACEDLLADLTWGISGHQFVGPFQGRVGSLESDVLLATRGDDEDADREAESEVANKTMAIAAANGALCCSLTGTPFNSGA